MKQFLVPVLALLAFARPAGAEAPSTGSLEGTVVTRDGLPLPYANVLVLQTPRGASTDRTGTFRITALPPGEYVVRILYMGYETEERRVTVAAGRATTVAVALRESAFVIGTVEVEGRPEAIDVESSERKDILDEDDIDKTPVDRIREVVQTTTGVVSRGEQLYVKGGRGGEVQMQFDGIPVNDPLVGGMADLATVAVSQIEVRTGGMDAEYGNAQSGVISLVTKEGGESFAGEVTYMTDDFGGPDKTYNNYDRIALGLGGPLAVRDLRYFVSVQGTWSDTYLKTRERRPVHRFLDFINFRERQNNDYQFQGKLTWTPGPGAKVTLEGLANRRDWDAYVHAFSGEGFVESAVDTVADTGEIRTLYGDFSREGADPAWLYYNAPEHTPDYTNEFRQLKVGWRHVLGRSHYTVKLSNHGFRYRERVQGRLPWEYDADYPEQWRDRIHLGWHDFYATHGDVPSYSRRNTTVWTLKTDWASQLGEHRFQTGFEARYNDLDLYSVDFPNRVNAEGQIGLVRSDFHYYHPEGSFYVQDQWHHEGMVINAGIRYDLFSVGDQLDASEVEDRVRSQWSPRVGIAYPITDRDAFSFHYGHFSQVPDRRWIFENRGGAVTTRGNPNLESETTVAYQAALQHVFSDHVSGQFAVYFKDVFGLLTTEEVSAGDNVGLVDQWVNQDYASSRGLEVSLRQRFTNNLGARLAYTYGVATGVASDPNQRQNANFLYLPIAEQPLDWDQRHTVSATVNLAEPGNWAANFLWSYGTGFPWTPRYRDTRRTDPALTNSRRLPGTTTLTVQAEKYYRVWGQQVQVFLRATNLLDARNIQFLEPANWPQPPQTDPYDYRIFYTETGRAGGAYLSDDVDEDGIRDWRPVNDPRVFAEGRSIRLGLGLRF